MIFTYFPFVILITILVTIIIITVLKQLVGLVTLFLPDLLLDPGPLPLALLLCALLLAAHVHVVHALLPVRVLLFQLKC